MSPKKLYKLGEVCSIVGVKSYVLRFWESEFSEIQFTQSSDGQKLYQQETVEAIAYIKKLLFDNKLTIERAKQKLAKSGIRKIKGIDYDKFETKEGQAAPINTDQKALIIAAREKLEVIVSLTKRIKKEHHWS